MRTEHAHADLLILDGKDAEAFARAQLSSDLRALDVGRWQWTAWLNASGRVRAFGHLGRCDDGRLLLLLRSGDAGTVAAELGKYLFRMQARIQTLSGMHLGAGDVNTLHAFTASDEGFVFGLGDRSLVLSPARTTNARLYTDEFARADIQDGYAWFDSETLDSLLPAALSLYRLGAVSMTKGCYPGQEIVARLHHLGGHKQHLHHISAHGTGTSDHAIETEQGDIIGWLLNRSGDHALAVLRDQALARQRTPRIVTTFAA